MSVALKPVVLAPASWALRGLGDGRAAYVKREFRRLHRIIAGELSQAQAQAERDADSTAYLDAFGDPFGP